MWAWFTIEKRFSSNQNDLNITEVNKDDDILHDYHKRLVSNFNQIKISKKLGIYEFSDFLFKYLEFSNSSDKRFADIFESIIGYVFVDVYKYDYLKLQSWLDSIILNNNIIDWNYVMQTDAKSKINRILQKVYSNLRQVNKKLVVRYMTDSVQTKIHKNNLFEVLVFCNPNIISKKGIKAIPIRYSFKKPGKIVKIYNNKIGYVGLPERKLKRWILKEGSEKNYFLNNSLKHDKASDLLCTNKGDDSNLEYRNIYHGVSLDDTGLGIMKIEIDGDPNNVITVELIPGMYLSNFGPNTNENPDTKIIEGSEVNYNDILGWVFMPSDLVFGTGRGRKIEDAKENASLTLLAMNGQTIKNHYNIVFDPEIWIQKNKQRNEHIKNKKYMNKIVSGLKVKKEIFNNNQRDDNRNNYSRNNYGSPSRRDNNYSTTGNNRWVRKDRF